MYMCVLVTPTYQTPEYDRECDDNLTQTNRMSAMAKKPRSHHVVPNSGGGWNVKKGGASRISGHYDKKRDAIDAGREISKNQGTEFYIHGSDGKIQRKDSHGSDPYPPKG